MPSGLFPRTMTTDISVADARVLGLCVCMFVSFGKAHMPSCIVEYRTLIYPRATKS